MKRLLLVLLFLALPLLTYAEEQLSGIASVYWHSTVQTFAADGCLIADGTTCALFPAGNSQAHRRRVVVTKFAGEGSCCWMGEVPVDVIIVTGPRVNAGGDHGIGPCAAVHGEFDGDVVHDRPSRTVQRSSGTPGTTDGLCPIAVGPAQSSTIAGAGDVLFAPCSSGACSADFGGGTCVASGSLTRAQLTSPGMILVCDTGVIASVRKERQLGPEEN